MSTDARLPWQQTQWQQIDVYCQHQRLPHALLLAGPEGMGKSIFARQLAQRLICLKPNTMACGQCSACQLFVANNHPDEIHIKPEREGGQISVATIRELTERLTQTAFADAERVIMIAPAEAMNRNAANALLKMLEEPPRQTVFILISEDPARMLATIRSRCQRIDFLAKPNEPAVLAYLNERLAPSEAKLLLQIANHAPLKALALAESEAQQQRAAWLNQLLAVAEANTDAIEAASACRELDLPVLISGLQSLIEDALYLQFARNTDRLVNGDQLQLLDTISAKPTKLFTFLRYLLKLQQSRAYHLNQQLVIEDMLIRWQQITNGNKASHD